MFNQKGISDPQLAKVVPAEMGTQHPDNASEVPFGNDHIEPYSTADVHLELETPEVHYNYQTLGIREMMVDTEGKLGKSTPYAEIVDVDADFYRENRVGHALRITPRIPNPDKSRGEPGFGQSIGQFVNSILVQKQLGFTDQAITEFIIPDSTNGRVIPIIEGYILDRFDELKKWYRSFGDRTELDVGDEFFVQGIPLIEDVENQSRPERILDSLIENRKKTSGRDTYVQRVFGARSDPALKAGMVPAILSNRLALARLAKYEKEKGVKIPYIIGAGSSPFRGGINVETINPFLDTYAGIATTTLQSAFRYDWPEVVVQKAVIELREKTTSRWLERHALTQLISDEQRNALVETIGHFKQRYEQSIQDIGALMLEVAETVPSHRDRFKFQGIGGYGREIAGRPAPRAIKFCAALYSLGLPPGILGLRAYFELPADQQNLLNQFGGDYAYWIRAELEWANPDNVRRLHSDSISTDLSAAKEMVDDFHTNSVHASVTSAVFHAVQRKTNYRRSIIEAAKERRFLG